MEIRTAYNYDRDQVSLDTGLGNFDKSLTQQSFKEECDINTIVERFNVTGLLPQANALPVYQNFEGIFDYQTAQNAIVQADAAFMQLPAQIRDRFRNSAAEMLSFLENEENREEAVYLGLLEPAPETAPHTDPT